MSSLLIRNTKLINPKNGFFGLCDILIIGRQIAEIGEGLNFEADTVLDVGGLWASPGLIDVHCHLREPGQEHKETIATGAKSAAAGGFTTICAMPNTIPPLDNARNIEYVTQKAGQVSKINILPIGAITSGMEGRKLTDFKSLKEAGVCAVSEDGKTVDDTALMEKAMLEACKNGLPIFCHCEDKSISAGGVMNDGTLSRKLGLKGIPDEAEDKIIAREIELSRKTGANIHICHVCTKGGVELIRNAKRGGLSITAEVCPHHFSLTDAEIKKHGANAKMAPPLRDYDDINAVIEGLKDATIDIIATDHAPHSAEEKSRSISEAPFGIVGFETALSLGITNLVNKGHLTPIQLIEKMSLNPAKLLGIDRGAVETGKVADLIIIDPEINNEVDINKFMSTSNNCPYNGMRLNGMVMVNITNGKVLYNLLSPTCKRSAAI